MTLLNFRDRCRTLIGAKQLDSSTTEAKVVDEPDREESPESFRDGSAAENLSFGSFQRRGTASWPSAAIDFNDLAALPAVPVKLGRSRLVSCESELQDRAACESFDSTVTDFDYLTSPGAQAEMNAEYLDAIRSAMPRVASDCTSRTGGAAPRPAFDMTGAVGTSSSSTLHAHAAELEFMAAQIMAQAYQAKAQALRAQSGLDHATCPNLPPACASPEPRNVEPRKAAQANMHNSDTHIPSKQANSERTTVMLRNLPNDYNRDMLVQLLNEQGFHACFDFLYLPMDLKRRAGLGYAFVNMVTPSDANRIFAVLQGFSNWQGICSAKVLEVAWGDPLQGLEAHVNRYRNSPVMHQDAPVEFRPLLFKDGERVQFPPPTRKLRAPRLDFRAN